MQKQNIQSSSVEFIVHHPWKLYAIFKELGKKSSCLEFLRRQQKYAVHCKFFMLCGAHLDPQVWCVSNYFNAYCCGQDISELMLSWSAAQEEMRVILEFVPSLQRKYMLFKRQQGTG